MFSKKVILCLLQYLLLQYNTITLHPVTHLSSLASLLKENHPNSVKMDFVLFQAMAGSALQNLFPPYLLITYIITSLSSMNNKGLLSCVEPLQE